MKKFVIFLLALWFGTLLNAQSTTVSATVVDSDTTSWINGTWSVTFLPNPNNPNISAYNINGTPLSPSVLNQAGALNGVGSFSMSVYQNNVITPVGSQWQLSICPQASAPCGIYVFPASGTTMDISAALTSIIPAPRFKAVANSFGYADIEAQIQENPGSNYFNTVSSTSRCYNGTAWQICNGAGAATWFSITGGNQTGSGASQLNTLPGALQLLNLQANSQTETGGAVNTTVTWTSAKPTCCDQPALYTGQATAESGGYNYYALVTQAVGFSISGNVITFQMLPNTFSAGQILQGGGFAATYLNGINFTILSTGLSSTSVQAAFTHADVTFTTDAGTLSGIPGTSTKTNWVMDQQLMLTRTAGQHIPHATVLYNTGDGDAILSGGQVYDTGNASTPGDEGVENSTVYLYAGMPQLSGTITAISSGTITIGSTVNGFWLGEHRALLNTSRNIYTTGTVSSIVGGPPVITGSSTNWSSLCPGGIAPCYPGNLWFEFTAEIAGGIHIGMQISKITSDTSATLVLINGGIEVTYNGNITSGAYSIYQGATIQAVPVAPNCSLTDGDCPIVSAVVDNPAAFQVGDNVMQLNGPNRSLNGDVRLLTQSVPVPGNSQSSGYLAISQGHFPVSWGFVAAGNFALGTVRGDWTTSPYTPIWGMHLQGSTPIDGFFAAEDTVNLHSLEKILCAGKDTLGDSDCIFFDRVGGTNAWELNNGNRLIGTDAIGNLTLPGGINAVGSIAAGKAIFNSLGGFGAYSNLLLYSQFDNANPAWGPPASTSCANTITANAALDPNGTLMTAERFDTPGGCVFTGQVQVPSPALTVGLPYTFSIWAKGGAGGENLSLYIGDPLIYNCEGPPHFLTTAWQQYSFTCTVPAGMTQRTSWLTSTPSATFYIWGATLVQDSSSGLYAHSVASPVTLAHGYVLNGNPVLPASTVTGYHGTAGTRVQLSDGTGAANNCAKFAADGSITDFGASCGGFTLTTSGTSGAATYSLGVLNIPQYTGGGGGGTSVQVNGAAALPTANLSDNSGAGEIDFTNPSGAVVNATLHNTATTVNGVSCTLGSTCTISASGLSGQTSGQVPVASSATTATSSKPIAGSGAGLTSGPTSSTSGDIASYTGTAGQLQDSGTLLSSLAPLVSPSLTTPSLGAATATSLIASGVVDGLAPATVVTSTTFTFGTTGGTYKSGYYDNENVTAATAVTGTLPTAAAGRQFCFDNAYNGSAANTGVLTIATSAAGQFIIYSDGTLTASGGNIASAGAGGDMACVRGVDSTHWIMMAARGTWTKN